MRSRVKLEHQTIELRRGKQTKQNKQTHPPSAKEMKQKKIRVI
jgi:hypothetical protein